MATIAGVVFNQVNIVHSIQEIISERTEEFISWQDSGVRPPIYLFTEGNTIRCRGCINQADLPSHV